jgi:hypothetical protein
MLSAVSYLVPSSLALEVCNATKARFQDMSCCGEGGGASVCVSPSFKEVNFTKLQADIASLLGSSGSQVVSSPPPPPPDFAERFCPSVDVDANTQGVFPPDGSTLSYLDETSGRLKIPSVIDSDVYSTTQYIMTGAEYCTTPMSMENTFAKTLDGWPDASDVSLYPSRAEYNDAVFALVDTINVTVDPVLFHTVRALVIVNSLLVLEGVAAAGKDSAISTAWLESVFKTPNAAYLNAIVPSGMTLFEAALESWATLRSQSTTFESYASAFDTAGYTYGSSVLLNDETKVKFWKAILEEHYLIVESSAVQTQALHPPLTIDSASYVDTFQTCTTTKALQHYMVQQKTVYEMRIACTAYGFLMMRSLQNILQAELAGECPSPSDVAAWSGEAAVATVYAGPTFAQRGADVTGANGNVERAMLTAEQWSTIWQLYVDVLWTHLPILQGNCDASVALYKIPILGYWASVSVPAGADAIATSLAAADPAWDDTTGARIDLPASRFIVQGWDSFSPPPPPHSPP